MGLLKILVLLPCLCNKFSRYRLPDDATFTTLQDAPAVPNGSEATISSITANWTIPLAGGGETFTYEIRFQKARICDYHIFTSRPLPLTSSYVFTGLNERPPYTEYAVPMQEETQRGQM